MFNETENRRGRPTVAELEKQLWEQGLHDPTVFNELARRRESLRMMTAADFLLLVCILVVTVVLSIGVHAAFVLPGVLVALAFLVKKRFQLSLARSELDALIGAPSALFNSIAVNKVMMDAFSRSAEVERYVRTMNEQGRHQITAFENDQMIRILSALDRQEGEMLGNSNR